MALQFRFKHPETGYTYPEAYGRVVMLVWDRELAAYGCRVAVYGDASVADRDPVWRQTHRFRLHEGETDADGNSLQVDAEREIFATQDRPVPVVPRAAAYGFLKGLPEYAGAVDV